MRVDLFDFDLPNDRIALRPARPRDAARLLYVPGQGGFADKGVLDLPDLLAPGDVLVFNDTRVVPARAFGAKPSGGRVEILLERVAGDGRAWVHLRASKAVKPGAEIVLPGAHRAPRHVGAHASEADHPELCVCHVQCPKCLKNSFFKVSSIFRWSGVVSLALITFLPHLPHSR